MIFRDIDTRLIERTTKSLTITPEGRQFYEYAKSLLRLREKTLWELLKEPYRMREDGSGTKKETDQFLETLGLDSTSCKSKILNQQLWNFIPFVKGYFIQ